MSKYNWPEYKKAIESKYNSFIENDTCKVVSLPTKANIITGYWIFKLKKDRFDNVLKCKAD